MTELYFAGRQLIKVKAMMILSLACALAAMWWGWDLFQTQGLRPADGGVLAPIGTRLAWGLGVASLGIAFAAAMWVYGRLYVSELHYDRSAHVLRFRTVGFVESGETLVAESDVLGSSYEPGDSEVDAPWIRVAIKSRRLPLILDAQGHFFDAPLAARLLKSR